jgi:hypothetical protein
MYYYAEKHNIKGTSINDVTNFTDFLTPFIPHVTTFIQLRVINYDPPINC